jgi:DDE family transposase
VWKTRTTSWATRLGKALGVIARRASAGAGGNSRGSRSWAAEWVEFESRPGRGTSDDPGEQARALALVLGVLNTVEGWLDTHPAGSEAPVVQESLATAEQVKQQDVQESLAGTPQLREGVAKDRRISVEDGQMRHGRKSRSVRVDGYKRHILRDLDTGGSRVPSASPLRVLAEATVTESIQADLSCQQVVLSELHIDRAYRSHLLVRQRSADLRVYCKAWPVRNGTRFPKTAFQLDWERQVIQCPHQIDMPFEPGGVVHFPAETCAACPLRERCTTSQRGRSVTIHPDEALRMASCDSGN